MQRATFDAALNEMKSKGLLEYTNKELLIKDREGLVNLLESGSDTFDDDDTPAE